jgi:predicted phosphodiesterase
LYTTFILVCLFSISAFTGYGDDRHAFGAIADCQYCAVEGQGVRKYSLSPTKLEACVASFNTMDLGFVVHLGDFIDRDFESFSVVSPIYQRLKMSRYHVLGNHDFSVADELKAQVPSTLEMPSRYYHFENSGWRFVVLDGNDISFHAWPEGSAEHRAAGKYYKDNGIQSPRWNGAVGGAQLSWLRATLKQATEDRERVILFCHFPVFPEDVHNLWNAEEVIGVIEEFPCVKAYINGHNHKGNYAERNGVHYLTLKGMVDTEETSYAVIRVDAEAIKVTGYGRESDRVLRISP